MNAHPRDIDRDVHFGSRRQMPESVEAERALLGAIFMNNEAYHVVAGMIEPEWFFDPLNREIFLACQRLAEKGEHINGITVKAKMPAIDPGDGVTLSSYLARLAVEAVSVVNAPDFASAIKAAAIRRGLISAGEDIQAAGWDEAEDLGLMDAIEAVRTRLDDMQGALRGKAARQTPGASYIDTFQAAFERDEIDGVPFCLSEFRRVLSEPCFEAGNLYGLLSSSGEGKTSLTMQLIYEAIRQGHPVLFLSYDQSPAQCVRQMIAQVHGIRVDRQKQPRKFLNDQEREQCIQFGLWLDRTPTEIIRCEREGVGQLCTYARRFVRQRKNGKAPFIVVDHIGKVKARDPRLSADRISGEVTVELKALAAALNASVLVLNQRNSSGTARDNPRPIARDLYGGEGARADYDAVIYLYRPEKYKAEREKTAATDGDWKKINKVFVGDIEGKAEIGAIKVRFGNPNITAELKFDADFTRYRSEVRAADHDEPRMAI